MTKAMSQSHKTDNSIAFFIKPFFRFVNVTCRFRSSLMRSMRIFFRPIDLFCTLSSVFLSAFSPGSQSREREKKRRGEKRQDLTFKRFRNQDCSPGRKPPRYNKATHRSLRRKPFDQRSTLSFSLSLSLSKETQRHGDTETLYERKSSSEEL